MPNSIVETVQTAVAEVSFVRANWGKLSAVVVFAFVAGFVVNALLF